MSDILDGNEMRSAYRRGKDVLSSEGELLHEDEMDTLKLEKSDLPMIIEVAGTRHEGYILKLSRSQEGVILEKISEKT